MREKGGKSLLTNRWRFLRHWVRVKGRVVLAFETP